MFRKLLVVRNASLISAPAMIASAIAGRRVRWRRRKVDTRLRSSAALPPRAVLIPAASTATSHPLDRRDQLMVTPVRAEFGHQPPAKDHEHPIADHQLVQIVRDD